MPLSFTHKYSLTEATEGLGVIYGEFTGNPVATGDLALAVIAGIDYATSVALPPSKSTKAAKPMTEDEVKAAIVAELAPHFETDGKMKAGAATAINWGNLLALIVKFLPFILPFLTPAA